MIAGDNGPPFAPRNKGASRAIGRSTPLLTRGPLRRGVAPSPATDAEVGDNRLRSLVAAAAFARHITTHAPISAALLPLAFSAARRSLLLAR